MTTEIANPLTTLLRKKYGINQEVKGSLTVSQNDTLYTLFRKTARFIYNNGSWTQKDLEQAIKDYLELSADEYLVKSVTPVKAEDSPIGSSAQGKQVYKLKTIDQSNHSQTRYMVIDPANKSWSEQGLRWHHRNDDGVRWYTGNLNYTIGYAKLLHDLYQDWQRHSADFETTINDSLFKAGLSVFVSHRYSGKAHEYLFKHRLIDTLSQEEFLNATEPVPDSKIHRQLKTSFLDHHPDFANEYGYTSPDNWHYFSRIEQLHRHCDYLINHFVDNYLQRTYNIVQQQKYESKLQTKIHARAWEQKANIDEATQEIMKSTVLNYRFNGIELDNDVDLKPFQAFEKETMQLMERLPQPSEKPTLRLRKLGNYKSLGMYVPAVNTLIVDFRKPSEVYQGHQTSKDETAGFSSFVHEYGHYLDYHLTEQSEPLSIQSEFQSLQQQYIQALKGTVSDKEFKYYSIPTEVFARAFEIYVHDYCGLRGNLNNCQLKGPEYAAFDQIREPLFKYFNERSEFRHLQRSLNLDTSVNLPKPDERQNAPQLKDWQKLAYFSEDMLHKWTANLSVMENLVNATSEQLLSPNPNRVVAYDKWKYKIPNLISRHELKELNIAPNDAISHIQGFTKINGSWYSDRLYNVDDLAQVSSPDQQRALEGYISRPAKWSQKQVDSLVKTVLPTTDQMTPLESTRNRMAQSLLLNRHSTEPAPFKFSAEEKELMADFSVSDRAKMYLAAVKLAQDKEPIITRSIEIERPQSRQLKQRKDKNHHETHRR